MPPIKPQPWHYLKTLEEPWFFHYTYKSLVQDDPKINNYGLNCSRFNEEGLLLEVYRTHFNPALRSALIRLSITD